MSKNTLEWSDVWEHCHMVKSKSTRHNGLNIRGWIITERTPLSVRRFLSGFGYRSTDDLGHGWEGLTSSQLAVVILNTAFIDYLFKNDIGLAAECGLHVTG